MIVLGLDTAQDACSAAIWADGVSLAHEGLTMRLGHAEALGPMVERVLMASGLAPGALTRIGVTVGPGTFTGLRVGLSLARGMGAGLACPVLGVTTLEAMAERARTSAPDAAAILVAIDARRDEAYGQIFAADLTPITPPALWPLADLQQEAARAPTPLGLAGTGARLLEPGLQALGRTIRPTGIIAPDARDVARLAAAASPADRPPSPLYLRKPDAALPQDRKRRPPPVQRPDR